MPGHGGEDYKDLLLFLAAAGVVAPLFSRLKLSPVLGFLAAGVLLGPHGLGRFADQAPWLAWLTITDREQVVVLSELGVAFLLFMIGLELSWERLKAMRRLVFCELIDLSWQFGSRWVLGDAAGKQPRRRRFGEEASAPSEREDPPRCIPRGGFFRVWRPSYRPRAGRAPGPHAPPPSPSGLTRG